MLGLGLGTTQAQGLVDALAQVTNTKSIIFDGGDEYISIPNLNITGACSFSLWIKPDTIHSYDVFFGSSNNYIRIQADNGGKIAWDSVSDSNVFDLSTPLVQDQWNHLALTRDGSGNGIVYLNGSSVSTGSGISGTLDYDRIGQKNDEGYFGGNMDEIAVWTSQLSADEITQIYNSGTANLDLSTNSGNYSSSANLKMWLRMGDEASTRVADGNANNLVIPDMRKTFFTGKSIDFDGSNDYIDIPTISAMQNPSNFTISAWVNPSSDTANSYIFTNYTTGSSNYTWLSYQNGTDAQFRVHDGTSTTTITTTGNVLPLNTWTHILGTSHSSDGLVLYINGSSVGSNSTTRVMDNTKDWNIGARSNGANNFNGKICDVALWDTVLDADTITSIYNSGEPNNLTLAASYTAGSGTDKSGDLQGYWRMGNGTLDEHPLVADQTNATLGSELNTNTTFDNFTGDSPDGWDVTGDDDSGNNISQGTGGTGLKIVSDSSLIYAELSSVLVVGKVYRYAIELADVTDDDVNFNHGGSTFFTADGKSADILYTGYFQAGSTNVRIIRSANCNVTVKSLSLKLVNGNAGAMKNMSEYDIVDHAPNRNSGDMINFDATSDIETDTP